MAKKKNTKAYDLARLIWRLGTGFCEKCGKRYEDGWQMHGAHLLGVGSHPRIGADLRNGMCLCSHCHRVFTSDPWAFTKWVETTKYQDFIEPLNELTKTTHKIFWQDELDKLKDIKKRIEEGELTLDEAREYYA